MASRRHEQCFPVELGAVVGHSQGHFTYVGGCTQHKTKDLQQLAVATPPEKWDVPSPDRKPPKGEVDAYAISQLVTRLIGTPTGCRTDLFGM